MSSIAPNQFWPKFQPFLWYELSKFEKSIFAVFWVLFWLWTSVKIRKSTYDPQIWPKTAPHISSKNHKIAETNLKPFKNAKFFSS